MVKKIIIWIVVSLSLAGVALVLFKFISDSKMEDKADPGETSREMDLGSEHAKIGIEVDKASLVSGEEIELSFETSGTVSEVFLKEGESTLAGNPIIKLDTKELELEKSRMEATLVQVRANLNKLVAGATPEELKISEARSKTYKDTRNAYKGGLIEVIKSGFTAADDAVRGKTNQLFNDPDSSNPQLSFAIADTALEESIESKRKKLNEVLEDFEDDVEDIDYASDFASEVENAKKILSSVQEYLDKVSLAVNSLTAGGGLSQETIDAWKAAVSAGRAQADAAKISIAEAYAKLQGSESLFVIASKEKSFQQAGSRVEDIVLAKAKVDEVSGQVSIIEEKIRRSTINAPFEGKIVKIWVKAGEFIGAGQAAVSFANNEQKIEAKVEEKSIKKVKIGRKAKVTFKALPDSSFDGIVNLIKPKGIVEDGDVYFLVEIMLDQKNSDLIPGMTAEVLIEE